jgi:hypothetical protein
MSYADNIVNAKNILSHLGDNIANFIGSGELCFIIVENISNHELTSSKTVINRNSAIKKAKLIINEYNKYSSTDYIRAMLDYRKSILLRNKSDIENNINDICALILADAFLYNGVWPSGGEIIDYVAVTG